MRASDDGAEASDKRDGGKPVFVSVGIALFIIGFLITVIFSAAASMDGEASSTLTVADSHGSNVSTFENLMAFLGIFIGLLGVVTATGGPLTTVVVTKGRR